MPRKPFCNAVDNLFALAFAAAAAWGGWLFLSDIIAVRQLSRTYTGDPFEWAVIVVMFGFAVLFVLFVLMSYTPAE